MSPSAWSAEVMPRDITRVLAHCSAHSGFAVLPDPVRTEAARTFLNWMGRALGGSREPAVELSSAAVAILGGGPQASFIGSSRRTDVASAAFVSCVNSSDLTFEDVRLTTVTHPGGPVAAASYAFSETRRVPGEDFVNALAFGIEDECGESNLPMSPPANFNVGFYVTGLTGPIGAAIAIGNLLRLDEQ